MRTASALNDTGATFAPQAPSSCQAACFGIRFASGASAAANGRGWRVGGLDRVPISPLLSGQGASGRRSYQGARDGVFLARVPHLRPDATRARRVSWQEGRLPALRRPLRRLRWARRPGVAFRLGPAATPSQRANRPGRAAQAPLDPVASSMCRGGAASTSACAGEAPSYLVPAFEAVLRRLAPCTNGAIIILIRVRYGLGSR